MSNTFQSTNSSVASLSVAIHFASEDSFSDKTIAITMQLHCEMTPTKLYYVGRH